MSDTPETDRATLAAGGDWSPVLRETCRRLERERNEARAGLEFRRGLYKVQEQYLEAARRESDEAQESARRWHKRRSIARERGAVGAVEAMARSTARLEQLASTQTAN